ncbi:MAG: tol-pal system YbgF family protein [Sandaracinaceae bacterium]
MARALAFASLLAIVHVAHAQVDADDEAARIHFDAGVQYIRRGAFEDGAREFTAAYELSHRPEMLYNISQAYRDAGRTREAIDALRRYLDEAGEIPNRPMLEERLRTMERSLEEGPGAAPPDEHDRGDEGAGSRGGNDTLVAVGAIGLGVGGAALVAAIVTGFATLSKRDTLDNELCDTNHACGPGYDFHLQVAYDLATATSVLLIAGGVVAAAGLTFLIVGVTSGSSGDAQAARIEGVGLGLGRAELRGRF